MLQIPRVTHSSIGGVLIGAAHGKLVHVQLADRYGIRLAQLGNNGRIINRLEIIKELTGTGSAQTLGDNVVLNPGRKSKQQAARCSGSQLVIQRPR
ncbi:hypothetical protein D3C81_1524620 [compost metagenome]